MSARDAMFGRTDLDPRREQALQTLKRIGDDLDRGIYPIAYTGGVVLPGNTQPVSTAPGEEFTSNAAESEAGSTRPEARPGEGPAGNGATGERSSGAAALILGQPGLTDSVREDLVGAIEAYPQFYVRFAPQGAWLCGWLRPIPDLPERVFLVIYYPLSFPTDPKPRLASWAWWESGVWVGPRHTNCGDGSICAFDPSDGVWEAGDALWLYMDLMSVWIVRHIFLRRFDRWPGKQVLHTAFERLRDHRPGELCGCRSGLRYEACHQVRDRRRPVWLAISDYLRFFPNPIRRPSDEVLSFMGSTLNA